MNFDLTKRTGGGASGFSADDIATNSAPYGDIVLSSSVTSIGTYAFISKPIDTVRGDNVSVIGQYAFNGCTALKRVTFPKAEIPPYGFSNCMSLLGIYADSFPLATKCAYQPFTGCTAMAFVVLPHGYDFSGWNALNNTGMRVLDIGQTAAQTAKFGTDSLQNSAIETMILRYPAVASLQSTSCFNGTKFASGGAGGTIYIPKALYDHLGDGTASDYKAATNWVTVDGYGTITWAAIEGSQYETQYADGTTIPSA